MKRRASIGYQQFDELINNHLFYVDKTNFIKEWWNRGDKVTLITRPRRFGKTLTMSMTEQFFSLEYAGQKDLFEGMNIWDIEEFRRMQGTYPVISFSFSDIKETSYEQAKNKIGEAIVDLYSKYYFLSESSALNEMDKKFFRSLSPDMKESELSIAIKRLSGYLSKYYGKKVIILLDEYDTPMQEAYMNGYLEKLAAFTRNLFHATFKNNPYLERAILTGITRMGKESIFSDLNNLNVVTTTSNEYADCFGFTQEEVDLALEEYGLFCKKNIVKDWYDGFSFGNKTGIYNPWSISNFLNKREVGPYWANTSSNHLAGQLIQQGSKQIKEKFETLLSGESIRARIDEQVVYSQLSMDENAIWSLFVASGYLKIKKHFQAEPPEQWRQIYELEITNFEVMLMFRNLVHEWFARSESNYNDFIIALLSGDLEAMNVYMNRIAQTVFSFFDSGKKPSAESEPERFYHGFVLGLIVELSNEYSVTYNRESGLGRYDVLLEPKDLSLPAFIIEFKVQNPKNEGDLAKTADNALKQIDEKKYSSVLIAKGIPEGHIHKYGFAFCGKKVLIK